MLEINIMSISFISLQLLVVDLGATSDLTSANSADISITDQWRCDFFHRRTRQNLIPKMVDMYFLVKIKVIMCIFLIINS